MDWQIVEEKRKVHPDGTARETGLRVVAARRWEASLFQRRYILVRGPSTENRVSPYRTLLSHQNTHRRNVASVQVWLSVERAGYAS